MDLNKAMVIGRLTRDPEGKTTPQGVSVSSFSVATNQVWTDSNGQKQEKVEYHNVVAWRKLADICNQYLKKGTKLYVEGRLETRDWEGQDGVKRYRTEIVLDNMIMLDSKPGGSSNFSKDSSAQNFPNTEIPQIDVDADTDNSNSNEEIKVENIPF